MNETVRAWYEDSKNIAEMAGGQKNGLKKWEKEHAGYFLPGGQILDIGCGTGREAFALTDMGCRVTGIDTSRKAIREARRVSAEKGYAIPFLPYDGHKLPFEDGSFDEVILWSQTFGLLYGDQYKREFLRECRRALKDGGHLSFSAHDFDFLTAHYPRFLKERRFYPYADTELYWEAFRPEELTALAENAGFTTLFCRAGAIYRPEDGTVLCCLCKK